MKSLNEASHVLVLPLLLVHGDGQVGLVDADVELLGILEPSLLLELLSLPDVHLAHFG